MYISTVYTYFYNCFPIECVWNPVSNKLKEKKNKLEWIAYYPTPEI